MKYMAIVVFFILAGCASVPAPQLAFIEVDGSTITYKGDIQSGDLIRIKSAINNESANPKLFRVSSGGGSIEEGIKIGRWIKNNKLNVEVVGGCLSSCANYIFTAGNKKILHKDSVLVWHGGAQQPGLKQQAEQAGAVDKWHQWQKAEADFFSLINVNSFISVCGQYTKEYQSHYNDGEATVLAYVKSIIGTMPVGFDYNLEDLKLFGIDNVALPDGEWGWRQYSNNHANLNVTRYRVQKSDNGQLSCV
ncbi:hypothetical protein QWY77_02095 [Thalassotalea ponticola]|uniref:hypothetical protein n=1 Tax=Thalassotalea ponticola TaxID=1523392 RepID=UPI0025B629F7|nr:hypothetical protein [Thalassotalea ponticola]MDN3651562.1 hypothetical protein [Thalassotalea ponticola]